MAKCPGCEKNWYWDWQQDHYIDDAKIPTNKIPMTSESAPEAEVEVYQCTCGFILSTSVCDGDHFLYVCKEWKGIDWEQDEHTSHSQRF